MIAPSRSALLIMTALLTSLALTGDANATSDEPGWADRIHVSGDFRARDEVFVRKGMKDLHRLRYRLRVGAETDINDHVDVTLRLATGSGARSREQTLGGGGVDFDPDGIFVDMAFVTFRPHGKRPPRFGELKSIQFGKLKNPLNDPALGPSPLLWDLDHTPEGVALQWNGSTADDWRANIDVVYFVFDEQDGPTFRDPGMFAVQFDNTIVVDDTLRIHSQASYHALHKLDDAFFARGRAGGNTAGLTSNRRIDLLDFSAAVIYSGIENWPVRLWGTLVANLSADGVGESKQNLAFGVGLNFGEKGTFAALGVAYFQSEADAVPAHLSDVREIDGRTNGETWRFSLTRALLENTDFIVVAMWTDELDADVRALQEAAAPDRFRIQTNVLVKF